MTIDQLETPCLLIDKKALMRNINRVQKIANRNNIRLRPHIKTHKSSRLFSMQLQAGAIGITASKIDEAIPFIESGVRSVKLVYPIVDDKKIKRFLSWLIANNKNIDLTFCIDSPEGLSAITQALKTSKYGVSVQIIIDVGYHRCGLHPSSDMILKLAKKIVSHSQLSFTGIVTHNGLTYGCKGKGQLSKLNNGEVKQLLKVKSRLEKQNISVKEISAGSTPGVLGDTSSLTGIDELRPGNYIFMDRTPVEMGLIKKKHVALSILSQIISENDKYYIIDAGKKVLSSDRRDPKGDLGLAYPMHSFGKKKQELIIEKLSEEHGFVLKDHRTKLKIGDRVRILPNHSCVVANLAKEYCFIFKGVLEAVIPIDAAGTSHSTN